MRLLLVSTPVSPIGMGDGGGVETTLQQLAPTLRERNHTVAVIAPAGSCLANGVQLYPILGQTPPSAALASRDDVITVQSHGVLERMWDEARRLAPQYDAILALSHDWLSYYLTPFLPIPVLHWVTLPSSLDAVDAEIARQYRNLPDRFAFVSRTQASTFPFLDRSHARIVTGAVDLAQFPFREKADRFLVWAARISPEKGLEDAVRVAQQAGFPLHVCGKIQDEDYWRRTCSSAPFGSVIYHGMLPHEGLSQILGRAMAMLVTPKWVEAFGLTVIEALACGTPVIAYDQGGPSEIVEHGRSGFLVPANHIGAMADAVGQIAGLSRAEARRRAEEYSVSAMAEKIEQWVQSVLELGLARGAAQ